MALLQIMPGGWTSQQSRCQCQKTMSGSLAEMMTYPTGSHMILPGFQMHGSKLARKRVWVYQLGRIRLLWWGAWLTTSYISLTWPLRTGSWSLHRIQSRIWSPSRIPITTWMLKTNFSSRTRKAWVTASAKKSRPWKRYWRYRNVRMPSSRKQRRI